MLDCFSGSGTTAKFAQLTNRSFIGCELDKTYYQKSLERLGLDDNFNIKKKDKDK